MRRRPRRTIPALLTALVLLVAAVLIAVSCIQVLLEKPPWVPFTGMTRLAATLVWSSPLVLVIDVGVGLVGMILLAAALLPGTPTVLPLDPGEPALVTGVTQASVNQVLTAAARDVDGVAAARVRVHRQRISASVRTPLRDTIGLGDRVSAAISDRLDDIALAHGPRIRVRVRSIP